MRVATNRETMDTFYDLEFDCDCGRTVRLVGNGGAYYGIPRREDVELPVSQTWDELLLQYDWTREVLCCRYCDAILAEVRIG